MDIKKIINGNEVILQISGRIDANTSPEFENAVIPEIKPDLKIVADFASVDYISSAGLRVLLTSHKKCGEVKAKFSIRNVKSDVLEILDMTGFSSILSIED